MTVIFGPPLLSFTVSPILNVDIVYPLSDVDDDVSRQWCLESILVKPNLGSVMPPVLAGGKPGSFRFRFDRVWCIPIPTPNQVLLDIEATQDLGPGFVERQLR